LKKILLIVLFLVELNASGIPKFLIDINASLPVDNVKLSDKKRVSEVISIYKKMEPIYLNTSFTQMDQNISLYEYKYMAFFETSLLDLKRRNKNNPLYKKVLLKHFELINTITRDSKNVKNYILGIVLYGKLLDFLHVEKNSFNCNILLKNPPPSINELFKVVSIENEKSVELVDGNYLDIKVVKKYNYDDKEFSKSIKVNFNKYNKFYEKRYEQVLLSNNKQKLEVFHQNIKDEEKN
jgi:hypothetical protein